MLQNPHGALKRPSPSQAPQLWHTAPGVELAYKRPRFAPVSCGLTPKPLRRLKLAAQDRLTTLPTEVLVHILQAVRPNPLQNAQLQTVHSRVASILRDNVFWSAYSPEAHIRPGNVEALYDGFQARTRRGRRGLNKVQQEQLRYDYSGAPARNTPRVTSRFDLALAAAPLPYPNWLTYRSFGDDATMMRALGVHGSFFLSGLSARLASDAAFMCELIGAHPSNYALADEALKHDDAFNYKALGVHGALLPWMPEQMHAGRDVVCRALAFWDSSTERPLGDGPYRSVPAQFHRDKEIVYACARIDAATFLQIHADYPQGRWNGDKKLIRLCLGAARTSYASTDAAEVALAHTAGWSMVAADDTIRKDAHIARLAVTRTAHCYTLIASALRNSVEWRKSAMRCNFKAFNFMLNEHRSDPELVAMLTPAQKMACLDGLCEMRALDKTALLALLADPSARGTRLPHRRLHARDSVMRRLSPALRRDFDVQRAVLVFDAREITFMCTLWQEKLLKTLSKNLFVSQLCAAHARASIRPPYMPHRPAALRMQQDLCPTHVQDVAFAQRFLLLLPELDKTFDAAINQRLDINQLARLGTLLQEEAGIFDTRHGAVAALQQLARNMHRHQDDFVLLMTLAMFHLVRRDWTKTRRHLQAALNAPTRFVWPIERNTCQQLLDTMPATCAKRGDAWYERAIRMAHGCHRTLARQAGISAAQYAALTAAQSGLTRGNAP